MKKIVSLAAAAAFALGLAGCSGDLHDSEDLPYDGDAYICGGLNGGVFELMTKEGDGTYTYTYTYDGTDGWAPEAVGESHFTITSQAAYDGGYRWQSNVDNNSVLEPYSYDNHVILKNLESGSTYKVIVTLTTQGGTIKTEGGSAPAAPVPYMLDGYYLVGCAAIAENAFSFSADGLIWGAEVDKASGEVTYIKDFKYTPCSDTWHSGAEAVLKLSTLDWKKNYGETPLVVGDDFVELKFVSDGGNANVSGLKDGGAYRLTIKTAPEEAVFAKVEEIAAYTLSFKVIGGMEGTEYFIDGTPWGASWKSSWPIESWGGSYETAKENYPECFATANESGEATFDASLDFVASPGTKTSYQVKVVSCTSDGAPPDIETGNIDFTIDVSAKTFVISIDVTSEEVKVE